MWMSRILRILLVLVIIGAGFHVFYSPSREKFYKKGIAFYNKGEFERAQTEFMKAISEAQEVDSVESRSLMLDAYLLAGEILDLRLGRTKRAVALYEEMIKLPSSQPKRVDASLRLASIYRDKLFEPEKAIGIYKKLIDSHPHDPRTVNFPKLILEIYMTLHEFEQVISDGEAYLNKDPEQEDAAAIRFMIADANVYLEQYRRALDHYSEVEREYPGSYHARLARFEMGNCLLKLGLHDQALQAYEQALVGYPNPSVVQLRIKETKQRMAQAEDKETMPLWTLKKHSDDQVAPPIIPPFPEDLKNYWQPGPTQGNSDEVGVGETEKQAATEVSPTDSKQQSESEYRAGVEKQAEKKSVDAASSGTVDKESGQKMKLPKPESVAPRRAPAVESGSDLKKNPEAKKKVEEKKSEPEKKPKPEKKSETKKKTTADPDLSKESVVK